MHISEGVLSPPVLLAGTVLAVSGVAVGLKKMDYQQLVTVALLSSAFFVASLIHVPIGPGNIHLVLNGIMGILLGWACFPAIAIALLLQAILFQFGGLTTLGTNTIIMAFPALICWYLFQPLLAGSPARRSAASFLCGFLSVCLSALLAAMCLSLSQEAFVSAARLLVLIHIPVMIIDGIITMYAISFIARVKPELLRRPADRN